MAVIAAAALGQPDPATYRRHWLHDTERDWPETNCYVDLWVELLHALGLDPIAACAFTLATDFDGEQWRFFKFPLDDLQLLYGLEVHELNLWRPADEHIATHLALGHYLTIEVDSWYLPDTAGVAYRLQHQKTSITPVTLDREAQRMTYFHGLGLFELAGDDYVGALRLAPTDGSLPPYTELVDLSRMQRPDAATLHARVDELVRRHLALRPTTNPVARMAEQVLADVPVMVAAEPEFFHGYAFGSLRQCGAWAEVAAAFVAWLDDPRLAEAVDALTTLSASAKSCQFQLARAARGRATDLRAPMAEMAAAWDRAYGKLSDVRG